MRIFMAKPPGALSDYLNDDLPAAGAIRARSARSAGPLTAVVGMPTLSEMTVNCRITTLRWEGP